MRGIILDRIKYKENDLKITILTDEIGKTELIVRSGQKSNSKMAAHVEPLNLVRLDIIQGKQINYVKNVYSVECFCELKSNISKINIASKAIFFIKKNIKENDFSLKILLFLYNFLSFLDSYKDEVNEKPLNIFFLKVLISESLMPEYSVFKTRVIDRLYDSPVNIDFIYSNLIKLIEREEYPFWDQYNFSELETSLVSDINKYAIGLN
ncbi:MAG: DNA repair protein RecO [Candidatus Falkowbacteria bacterium]|nr:DNA repair protein RecO [Candidatus Falkowbacteria bacterium]